MATAVHSPRALPPRQGGIHSREGGGRSRASPLQYRSSTQARHTEARGSFCERTKPIIHELTLIVGSAPSLSFIAPGNARATRSFPTGERQSVVMGNDPSAGSPTETLLRLHLPLNVEV